MISTELIKGTLKYLVLNLLRRQKQMYGYEITQELEKLSGGSIRLTFAALYPVLHKLEAGGLLHTRTENVNNRLRKYYALTGTGEREAEKRLAEFSEYLQTMNKLVNE